MYSILKKPFLLLSFLCGSMLLNAQVIKTYDEVIYLKNGETYRGTIVEQIPGKSTKIRMADGTEKTIAIADIEKFTKEPAKEDMSMMGGHCPMHGGFGMGMCPHMGWGKMDSLDKKSLTYAGQIQLSGGYNMFSARYVGGFRMGKFMSGIGVGFDAMQSRAFDKFLENKEDNNNRFTRSIRRRPLRSAVIPVFLHFEKDYNARRFTPVAFVEFGYAFPVRRSESYSFHEDEFTTANGTRSNHGALYLSNGFGSRFKFGKRFSMGMMIDFKWYGHFFKFNEDVTSTKNSDVINRQGLGFNLDFRPGLRLVLGF